MNDNTKPISDMIQAFSLMRASVSSLIRGSPFSPFKTIKARISATEAEPKAEPKLRMVFL